MHRFILYYALIGNPIAKLLRNDQDFEWTLEVQRAFAKIKVAIVSSPILVSPYFDNHFNLYYFYFEYTIASMLTQKNRKGEEIPISFMSKELHDFELRYSSLEKQTFALVRVVSYFRPYILSSPNKAYVPHPPIKMILNQPF